MHWVTPELKAILIENGTRFFAAKKSDREEVVVDIVEKLKAAKEGLSGTASILSLNSQVKTWYNNEIARFRQPQETKESSTKIKVKRWDAKALARDRNKEHYDEIKEGLSAAGTEWNELHRRTMEKIWDELDADEQEKCFNIAKSRNSRDLKEGEKCQLASTHADEEIAAFVRKMHNIYGARMVCLTSWIDDKGHAQTSVHETSASPKFSQQFPNWKTQKGMVNAFLEYSESFKDADESDEDEADQLEKKAKYPWAHIDFYGDDDDLDERLHNYPILPKVPKGTAGEWIGGCKIVIRAFVKAVHQLETGSSTVPWSSMATPEGAHQLIVTKYLPAGLGLKDPSRMVKTEVKAYYKLWMARQDAGKKPLVFKVEEAKEKGQKIEPDNELAEKDKQNSKSAAASESQRPPTKKKAKTAKDTNDSAGKSKSGGSKPPAPRPVLKPAARVEVLLKLSTFGPYQSLVQQMLKAATSMTAPIQKKRTPAWASWAIQAVEVGKDFFNPENDAAYLSNWKAVLRWMAGNPHIPAAECSFHHTEACDILLVIGLTLRECKICSEAEPDTPLHEVPFNFRDFEQVQEAVQNMLSALGPKKAVKWGVSPVVHRAIESAWRKVCLEVGLAEEDIQSFGGSWKVFAKVTQEQIAL
ncbi:hypothetical protein B0H13DRAFT_2391672 [Mycena leptocephala]|nr:hypothetical protein B0H13DRAFT_2391672 [Mycena leptocephala]